MHITSSMMESLENLPSCIQNVHLSLGSYLGQRHEVANIRRVLASHLSICLNPKSEEPVSRPLSIISSSSLGTETASSGLRGARREYLRSVKANIRARKEYDEAVKEHHATAIPESQPAVEGIRNKNCSIDESESCLNQFLTLVTTTRKNERLHIYQDYLGVVARKPAAETTYFDCEDLLKSRTLPEVPREVMHALGTRAESECTDLEELVNRLEKSVLRAKYLLDKERKKLENLKKKDNSNIASVTRGDNIEALGMTRNELIYWIETELGKTNESPEDDSSADTFSKPDSRGEKKLLESLLISIQKKYPQYLKLREAAIQSATETLAAPCAEASDRSKEISEDKFESANARALGYSAYPYLEELATIFNDQKSVLQQRSHLTTSLAKQLKDSNQGLDLLAEESHLLPAHPLPADSKASQTFAETMLNLEKPDSSRKAKEWVFAATSASLDTQREVSRKLEEGDVAVSNLKTALLSLQELLGTQVVDDDKSSTNNTLNYADVWELLDGKLGVIKGDD